MTYASLAGKTGQTWAIKRNRVWFFARQAKVVEITGYTLRTVQRMTLRLIKAGRLRCVQSGRGRLPHAIVVVPDGWNSQSRGDPVTPLRSVEASDDRINRAFTKRRAPYATRLVEEETPSQGVKPAEGPVTQPAPFEGSPSVPSQSWASKKDLRPAIKIVEPPADPEIVKGILAELRDRHRLTSSVVQPELPPMREVPIADPTPERVAAAHAIFAQVDANKQTGTYPTKQSVDPGGGYTGGTPDICPNCQHDRIYYGSCSNCGADLRDYGGDFNYGH